MKHRHSGPPVRYRTKRGRIRTRKRPMHSHERKRLIKKYQPIVNLAKKKGYKVLDLDRKQSAVDEVDIPEVYKTDAFIIPDREGKKRRDLIFVDDDARIEYQRRAFAHELGHQHLFATGQDDEEGPSNVPHIEKKADKIGADILGMTIKEFNSPDVTHNDVITAKRNFFPEQEDRIEKTFTKEGRFLFPNEDDEDE